VNTARAPTIAVLVAIPFVSACFWRAGSAADEEHEAVRRAALESARPWAGCLSLTVGPWQSASGQVDTGSMFAPRVTLPDRVRLDVVRHRGYLLMTPAPDSASGYGSAAWLPIGTDPQRDTLVLIWLMNSPQAFSPILWGPMTQSEGRYRGRLTVSTDVLGIERPYRELSAIREPCGPEFIKGAT
jgi:hypothetical protein